MNTPQALLVINPQLLETLQQWSASVLRHAAAARTTSISGRGSVTNIQNELQGGRHATDKVAILYGFPIACDTPNNNNSATRECQATKLVADNFVIIRQSSLQHRLEFERELLNVSCYLPGGSRPVAIWYRQVVEVGITIPGVDNAQASGTVDRAAATEQQTDFNLQEIQKTANTYAERAFAQQHFDELPQFFLGCSTNDNNSGLIVAVCCVRPSMSDASSPPRFENYFYRWSTNSNKCLSTPVNFSFDAASDFSKSTQQNAAAAIPRTLAEIYHDFLQRRIPFRVRFKLRMLIRASDSKRRLMQNIDTACSDLQDQLFPPDRSTYYAFSTTSTTTTKDAGEKADNNNSESINQNCIILGIEKPPPLAAGSNRSRSSSTDISAAAAAAAATLQSSSSTAKSSLHDDSNLRLFGKGKNVRRDGIVNSQQLNCREFAKLIADAAAAGHAATTTNEKKSSNTSKSKKNKDTMATKSEPVSLGAALPAAVDPKAVYKIFNTDAWIEARPYIESAASWQLVLPGRSPLITIPAKPVIELPIVIDAVSFVHELSPLKYLPLFIEDAIVRQLNAACQVLKWTVQSAGAVTVTSSPFASTSLVKKSGSGYISGGSDSGGEENFTSSHGSSDAANDRIFISEQGDDDDENAILDAVVDEVKAQQIRRNRATERVLQQLFDYIPVVGHYFIEQPICRLLSIVNVPSHSRHAVQHTQHLATRLMRSFFLLNSSRAVSSNSSGGGLVPALQSASLRVDASIQSNRSLLNGSAYIVCPHFHVKLPSEVLQTSMLIAMCRGLYTYHHYMHENFNDKGWGCAYRSLQTVWSWLRLNGAIPNTNNNFFPPQHRVIQQTLVSIGDKPSTFVGSRQWIGSMELGYFLNEQYKIECRYLRVESGEEMPTLARQLLHHFETEGCPVMIGGGQLAHTVLGVAFRDSDGYCQWLVLDPHYTGNDANIDAIVAGGWCGWKETSFWQKQHYYNLCLPRITTTK